MEATGQRTVQVVDPDAVAKTQALYEAHHKALDALKAEPERVIEDDEAEILGGSRPGRLAARIQKDRANDLPDLIATGIERALNNLAIRLTAPAPVAESDAAKIQMGMLAHEVEELQAELERERNSGYLVREDLNVQLRKAYATRDSSPMPFSVLHESWRGLGKHAIAHGWTIQRTPSGHLMWKRGDGKRYYTPSTPSDVRAVTNAYHDMMRDYGLPKMS
jgi:hypothetical protein